MTRNFFHVLCLKTIDKKSKKYNSIGVLQVSQWFQICPCLWCSLKTYWLLQKESPGEWSKLFISWIHFLKCTFLALKIKLSCYVYLLYCHTQITHTHLSVIPLQNMCFMNNNNRKLKTIYMTLINVHIYLYIYNISCSNICISIFFCVA